MTPLAADALQRKVLLAVELIDPVSMMPVCRNVRLRAVGLRRAPLINWSGRFVWLDEDASRLRGFAFDPGSQPYEAQIFDVRETPSPGRRLLRFMLRPTAAYPFGEGLLVVRGRLRETPDVEAAPIANARVWIGWTDQHGKPHPAPGERLVSCTSAHGEFAACLRLHGEARPERNEGMLAARIVVEHEGETGQLEKDLPDGQLLDLSDALAWSALTKA